jgi:hypothetical protein
MPQRRHESYDMKGAARSRNCLELGGSFIYNVPNKVAKEKTEEKGESG